MPQIQKKSIRKLVTLPPDLAERVEEYRKTSGASSESDALKALIEDGLKMRDRPRDLFRRCETAAASGQSIGDIINLVTADHPLVQRTTLDNDFLDVFLKMAPDAPDERFRFARAKRLWSWEYRRGDYDDWAQMNRDTKTNAAPNLRTSTGDLDDEIPF